MSLFSGLKKCENEFCHKYIYEKDKGKYMNDKQALCSPECLHASQIAQYLAKMQGKVDFNMLMGNILSHFEKFKEEILVESVCYIVCYGLL